MEIVEFIGSLILTGTGMFLANHEHNYSRNGFRTKATVKKLNGRWERSHSSFSYYYYTVVVFTTEDKEVLEQEMQVYSSIPSYYKGQVIDIIYYNNQVYPAGKGVKILAYCLFLSGLVATAYQVYYW